MLCETCRNIFENKHGVVEKEAMYHVLALIAAAKEEQTSDPPPSQPEGQEALMFRHHLTARSFEAAAQAGCHICNSAWRRLGPDWQRRLLDFDPPDSYWSPVTYCSLLDRNFFRTSGMPEDMLEKLETTWGIQLNPEAFKGVSAGSFSFSPFALLPIREMEGLDFSGELSPSTDSEGSLTFATERFRDCVQNHERCRESHISRRLPSRLIRINDTGEPTSAHLVLSKDVDEAELYFTMSHCWGSGHVLRLTKDKVDEFRAKIPVSELPKAFIDCFDVVRRLGGRYVWIDSLCIVQDDPDDWLSEASQMHAVYSGSHGNICSTGFADTEQGLFVSRDTQLLQPCVAEAPWMDGGPTFRVLDLALWNSQVLEAPLNNRAWVVQEHFLAPRHLHFGDRQILWECCELSAAEQFPNSLPRRILNHYKSPFNSLPWSSTSSSGATPDSPKSLLVTQWASIVSAYTSAMLSFPSDKAIAFAGIATRFEAIMGDKCLAGMWSTRIHDDLLWHVDFCLQCDGSPSTRPSTYRAPSFSWMSVDGRVSTEGELEERAGVVVQVREFEIQQSRGLITGGYLRITGVLRPVMLFRMQVFSGPLWHVSTWVDNREAGVSEWRSLGPMNFAWMDVDDDYSGVFFVMPVKTQWAGPSILGGLVLGKTAENIGEYKRVGMLVSMGPGRAMVLEHNDDEVTYPCESYDEEERRHTITIV